MLQRPISRVDNILPPSFGNEADTGIGQMVTLVLAFLRRRYPSLIITTTLGCLLAVGFLWITPPVYTAQIQVVLENPKAQFGHDQSILAAVSFDASQFETQIQMIKSRGIAADVINRLKLAEDPDFNGSQLSLASAWPRLRDRLLSRQAEPQAPAPDTSPDSLIAAFQSRITAGRSGYSNLIEIGFSASKPVRAAEIVNATADVYIAHQLNAKSEVNRRASDWMQERLRDIGEQALAAERAVSVFKSQNNVVSSGGKPIDEQQISELNTGLVAARAHTAEALAKLNRYDGLLQNNAAGIAALGSLETAGADALTSPIINSLRQQYLELDRRVAEWTPRFGRDHSAVLGLRNRMRELRGSILDEVKRYAETSRSEVEIARQRQQEIEKRLADAVTQSRSTTSAEITIRELESRAKGLRSLHDSFLQRYMGSAQQDTFPIADVRVMYPAVPPQSKSKPKGVLILAFGLIGGAALGVGIGLFREVMDRAFHTGNQVETALGLPCLSLVPALRGRNTGYPRSRASDQDIEQRRLSTASIFHSAIVTGPSSRFAESIRAIKLAIDLSATKTANQVIGMTSTLPDEGKTTIAASLAHLITFSGKSVIIVDCDLRNPSLSSNLAASASDGIVEVINGKCELDEAIWKDSATGLALLPAVRRKPAAHTNEILAAESMRQLFDRLKASYDYVIVDLPPLAPLVDVRSTTAFIDCFVLVIAWGETKVDVVRHALHTAPNVTETIIGAVLNKTDIKAMSRYDTLSGDYYSHDHDQRYGLAVSG
jgi:exopolysaccharide transport family protein